MTRELRVPHRAVLVLTGATLAAVGAGVALVPQAFYDGYGITLADGEPLLGELRASGSALLLLGALVGAGAVVRRLAPTAALVGAATMLAHAAGRLLSWFVDGGLAPGLVGAGAAELVLGTACLWALRVVETPETDSAARGVRPCCGPGAASAATRSAASAPPGRAA